MNSDVLFVKCLELPQKDEIVLQQTQVFWRSFPSLCRCRAVVVVTAVDAEPVCLQQFAMLAADSAACDVRGSSLLSVQ